VLYRYTPDRKGEHCRAHLDPFGGHLHAEEFAPGVCPARDLDDGGRHALGALVELLESSVPVGAIRYARSRWDALTRYDRRASDQQDRRATALEYRSTGDAKRRRLTSPLSSR
jgi:hypothetical protein